MLTTCSASFIWHVASLASCTTHLVVIIMVIVATIPIFQCIFIIQFSWKAAIAESRLSRWSLRQPAGHTRMLVFYNATRPMNMQRDQGRAGIQCNSNSRRT